MGLWKPLIYLLFLGSLAYSSECPSSCKCIETPTYKVDCSNSGLTSVPKLPIETEIVDLSGNSIKLLPNKTFSPILKTIDLSGNGLVRLELNAFADLRELTKLDLSSNNLDNNDFREQELFRGCREVQELNLSRNSLTQIPDKGFQLLTKLVKLDLSNNMLNDPTFGAEYVSIDRLEYVDLSGNNFMQIHHHSFQVLRDLKTLNLSNSQVHSIETNAFQTIDNLVNFDISNNKAINQGELNATIQSVCRSQRLSTLKLAHLNISNLSYVLEPLRFAGSLELLDLSGNNLAEVTSVDMSAAKNFRKVDLSHNKLQTLPSLQLTRLTDLDISHNSIKSLLQQSFENSEDLMKVDVSHNLLTTFDSSLFHRNNELETLDMSHNNIVEIVPIEYLENLKELDISHNSIDDPSELFFLYALTEIHLGSNRISRLGSNMIPSLSSLTHLNLTGNLINYIASNTFSDWNPRVIDLSFNRLSGVDDWGLSVVTELYLQSNTISYIEIGGISKLNRLEVLNLSSNRLETLPNSFLEYLTDLSHIDLSNNDLGDFLEDPSVPGVFSSSSPIRLEKLSLSSNSLKILRPGYLSNLTVLEHLDLSHNKLTDVNSRQFQELNLLKSLDISYNELSEFNYTTVNSLVSLKSLDLSGISWTCDCTIEDTLEWLQTTKISLIGYQKYECAEPNSKKNVLLSELNLDGEKCNVEIIMEKTIILIIIGCTSFVILVVAAIVFWQHRWRLKKKLKKQHYRAMYERSQMPLPNNNDATTVQTEYHPHTHGHHHSHMHAGTPHKTLPPCNEHTHPAFI